MKQMPNIRLLPSPQAEISEIQRRMGHLLKLRADLSIQLIEIRKKTEFISVALEEADNALLSLEHTLGSVYGR